MVCRLLHATLPQLHELQEVRIFVVGGMTRQQLALLAELLHACTSLHELSVSFAPEPSFIAQDLDVFGGCASLPSGATHSVLFLVAKLRSCPTSYMPRCCRTRQQDAAALVWAGL